MQIFPSKILKNEGIADNEMLSEERKMKVF
jgi:hypothetical protein